MTDTLASGFPLKQREAAHTFIFVDFILAAC